MDPLSSLHTVRKRDWRWIFQFLGNLRRAVQSLPLFSGASNQDRLGATAIPCWGLTLNLVPEGTGQECGLGARLKPSCSGYYITETGRVSPHTEQLAAVNQAQLGTAGKGDRTPRDPAFRLLGASGPIQMPQGTSSC